MYEYVLDIKNLKIGYDKKIVYSIFPLLYIGIKSEEYSSFYADVCQGFFKILVI